ncbi:MAG TPA: response regulator [Chitinophagaceae bacterium]
MEHSHTVLCIDDDAEDLELLQHALESTGRQYTIIEAHDGLEGIRRLHELKNAGSLPCLIVLDVNMPRMDGRETFRSIRADEQLDNIPVVVFSTSKSHVDQMYFSGKNVEYISKPAGISPLEEIATRMLQRCER